MIMNEKLRKGILQSVSNYLDKKGFNNFRSGLENMDNTKKIVEKQSGEIYQPDMTANYKESLYVFEIETGESIESNKEKFIRKCDILQQHAASKKGKLYLIVPVQKFDSVLSELNKNNLENIGILKIKASA